MANENIRHRELRSVPCEDLNGKEVQKRGCVCVHGRSPWLCSRNQRCAAETNAVKQLCFLKIKINFQKMYENGY